MEEQPNNVFQLKELSSKASTRKKLYRIVQKVYDLPNFGPEMSQEYLAELIKPECRYLKVLRSQTNTVPKGEKRNWSSVGAFNLLVKTLQEKGKKPCGFTHFAIPNIDWMLRIIIWADPSVKEQIIDRTTSNKRAQSTRQKEIESQQVAVDPKYLPLFIDRNAPKAWPPCSARRSPAARSRTRTTASSPTT